MSELADGLFIAPEHVAVIQSTGENECTLWTVGQGTSDGHILPYHASQVAEVIEDYFNEEVEDEEEPVEEEE